MNEMSQDDWIIQAMNADTPFIVASPEVRSGGVDPLGLRQINFQLMDLVLPVINNVAKHIRPFVVVTWAWYRAAEIARESGAKTVDADHLKDFTSRIEVLFAWSQFLINSQAELPGGDVLATLVQSEQYRFGGNAWTKLRKGRTDSTALTAAINYGPSLKGLSWVVASDEDSKTLRPVEYHSDYLAAFAERMRPALDHPAFSQFGTVEVTADDVRRWAELWRMDQISDLEKHAAFTRTFGEMASTRRRAGFELIKAAFKRASPQTPSRVRALMASPDLWNKLSPDGQAAGSAWRELQVRQLFRLSLEGLFYWITRWIDGNPTNTADIAAQFIINFPSSSDQSAQDWLQDMVYDPESVVTCLEDLDQALSGSLDDMPAAILAGLATALSESPEKAHPFEATDRLPLANAAAQAKDWGMMPLYEFMTKVIGEWVLAQHTYWAVGRGLAVARSNGTSLLRLKLVLEDGGWTNVAGTNQPRPNPTRDRLDTALSLALEAGALG